MTADREDSAVPGDSSAAFDTWASLVRDVLRPSVLGERYGTALGRMTDAARTLERALIERGLEGRRWADASSQTTS
ncbi:hypothetical protein SAMN00790413_06247 [Deinococcus hopiensis KR-140]|uniref:Uncharacterized protein n=2 Tax=Deinococcus TaxID=1298 RepID=A0A1W1VVS1_9DEIO|nr:hypothetical protein SAMN00790413_06247 [Deinococcus hopiensis KR-140]